MSDLPKRCVFLDTCLKKVTKEYFEHICSKQTWIQCDLIKPADVKTFLKIPSEWNLNEVGKG